MRFGVREICDVVLKAKTAMKVGDKVFYKNEPVCYFDSLKTSSLESQANAVYATGGRGNARLVSWEGERTVTFTMEDALISPISFSILSGAGVIDAKERPIYMHTTEQTDKVVITKDENTNKVTKVTIQLDQQPYVRGDMELQGGVITQVSGKASDTEDFIYVMLLDDRGEVVSEPFIAGEVMYTPASGNLDEVPADINRVANGKWQINIYATESVSNAGVIQSGSDANHPRQNDLSGFINGSTVLVDYYVKKDSGAKQVNITPETFGGNFYLEASTLFRTTQGIDVPAEFVIPNCKVQSNFTFTMAATGDPSTFTFTMDAFPDYTRWDHTKKVFASIMFVDDADDLSDFERLGTRHDGTDDEGTVVIADVNTAYNRDQKPYIEDPRRTKI